MKHLIKHVTRYRYPAPVNYSIQTLRLTPRRDDHQHALRWQIQTPGEIQPQVDAYGNVTHTLTLHRTHSEIEIHAVGQVDIHPLAQGHVGDEEERLPVYIYGVPTALTQCDDTVRDFCRRVVPSGLHTPQDVLTLAGAIRERVAYQPGMGSAPMPAPETLSARRGGSHDQTHLLLACVRAFGTPARFVSGYWHEAGDDAASHGWADVWLAGHGWVSVDVSHATFASDGHCRLAVARDYESASPVRWLHGVAATLSMNVSVQVQTSH